MERHEATANTNHMEKDQIWYKKDSKGFCFIENLRIRTYTHREPQNSVQALGAERGEQEKDRKKDHG